MKGINYSLNALMRFCESLKDVDGKSASWANGRKSACKGVLQELSPDETADIRKVDIDLAANKYGTRLKAKPKTVREYRNRVRDTIQEFMNHVRETDGVEEEVQTPSTKAVPSPLTKKKVYRDRGRAGGFHEKAAPSSITHQLPIRSNFLAQMILPFDLSNAEAKRLSTWILALPMKPEEDS